MTITSLPSFSGLTDNAPASPSYFNSKFSQVVSMITTVNESGTSIGQVTAALSRGSTTIYADQMAGADWGEKVLAAYSLATHGSMIDASALSGKQVMSSTLTIDVPFTTLRVSSALSLNMSTFGVVVPVGTDGVAIESTLPWGSRTSNGAYPQGQWDYRGTGNAIVVGDATGPTLNFRMRDVGIWLGGSGSSSRGIILNQCLYFDLERVQVLGKTGSTHSNIGIVVDGTDSNNNLFAGWGTIRQPVLNRMWRGIVGTGVEPYSANAVTVLGGSLQGMGSGVSGCRGISVDNGRGWFVHGTDIDGFDHGVHLDTANHHVIFRGENNAADIFLSSSASLNYINNVRESGVVPVDNGAKNIVIMAGTFRGTVDLAANGARLSIRTVAAGASLTSSNLSANEVAFQFNASGASFGIRSGGTVWYFSSSLSTKG